MDTMARPLGIVALVVACTAVVAVVAGCSSSPDPNDQARQERSAVLPAAEQLRDQLKRTGVGWTALVLGDYESCGSNDPLATSSGKTMVQYTASQETLPFSHAVSFPVFAGRVITTITAAGWKPRPVTGPSAQARYYAGQRGGLDLRLVEFDDEQGAGPHGSFHPTATVYVSGSCFDAGSSAHDFIQRGAIDSVHSPIPTATG
jgi:hypothetical protein